MTRHLALRFLSFFFHYQIVLILIKVKAKIIDYNRSKFIFLSNFGVHLKWVIFLTLKTVNVSKPVCSFSLDPNKPEAWLIGATVNRTELKSGRPFFSPYFAFSSTHLHPPTLVRYSVFVCLCASFLFFCSSKVWHSHLSLSSRTPTALVSSASQRFSPSPILVLRKPESEAKMFAVLCWRNLTHIETQKVFT